jgi:hypothetical protein
MDFRDNDALMARIRQDMLDVTRVSAEWLTDKVQESVQTNVYDAWEWEEDHPRTYERTYQFLNSWEPERTSITKDSVAYLIHSEPSKMFWNPDMYQHGSDYRDRTENMDENIQEGKNYDFFGGASEDDEYGEDTDEEDTGLARDYWSDVVEYIDQDVLDLKFAQGLTKLGLKFIAS